MKLTAVEWYADELNSLNAAYENGKISYVNYRVYKGHLLKRAEEMDKQQKMDAWNDGNCNTDLKGNPSANYAISAEHYYNQKYGGNNDQQ